MTLQELLNEARRLTLRDQIYLTIRLMEWVQQQVSPDERVYISDATELFTPSEKENPEQGSIDYLMANPLPVRNFKPLSREEIYDRS